MLLLHFIVGAILYFVMWISGETGFYKFKNPLLLVFFAGLAKEIHDFIYSTSHTASILDLFVTFLGGLIVYLIRFLFKKN